MSTSPRPAPPSLWTLLPLLTAAVCLTAYVATAAPGLTWAHDGADGGDLIAACETGGVPHPSGYPTYCLLARLWARLAPGDLARRYTLFSALTAATSAGLIGDLARRLWLRAGGGRYESVAIAAGCGLIWGLGPALWSLAVITEVYTLHALFAALLLWRVLTLRKCSPLAAWVALGLVVGLGLGNHLTLALLLPGLLLWLWPLLTRRKALAALGGLALGLCAYLDLPLAARGNPLVAWGDPGTWRGFWWLVSGQMYRGYVMATPLAHWPVRIADLAARAIQQFTLPGLALVLLGTESALRPATLRQRWAGALLVSLPALYALGYHTSDSHVYLLPVWMLGALALVPGAMAASQALAGRPRLRGLLPMTLLAVGLWLGVTQYGIQDLSDDRIAEDWLKTVATETSEGALVITGEDGQTFALDYWQWAQGERRDLVVVDPELWAYPWYRRQLSIRHPDVALPLEGSLEQVVAAGVARGPVYLATRRPSLEAGYEVRAAGALWELRVIPQ